MSQREYGVEERVPEEGRHIGFWDMTATWAGANCHPTVWWMGGIIAASGVLTAFGVTILVNPIVYFVLALIGFMGYKVTTTTMGLTRVPLGIRGSVAPSILNIISNVGWAAVANFFAAIPMSYLFADFFGWPAYGEPGSAWVLLLGASINAILALGIVLIAGSRSIKIAERVVVIAMVILSVWMTVAILKTMSISQILAWQPDPSTRIPVGSAVDVVAAFSFGWVICIAEFTRYTKTRAAATIGPMVGATVAFYWFAFIGTMGVIAAAITTGTFDPNFADPSSVAASLGLGWVALLIIIMATVTTNLISIYIAVMTTLNIKPKLDQRKNTWFWGLAALVLSWVPVYVGSFLDTFMGWLNFLGILIPPLAAILVVDFYLIRKKQYDMDKIGLKNGPYWYKNGINKFAFLAWGLGITMNFVLQGIDFGISSIGAILPGFFVSCIIYYIIAKATKAGAEVREQPMENKA
jgi:NCS1 nucleoside transporter family